MQMSLMLPLSLQWPRIAKTLDSQRTAVGRNSKMGKIMNDIINLIKENSMC